MARVARPENATLALATQKCVAVLGLVVAAALFASGEAAGSDAAAADPSAADAPAADALESDSPPAGPPDTSGTSPQSAMRGFLTAAREGDWADAARYLDLRRVPPAERETRGPELAHELKWALDRTLWVELDELSAEPAGEADDGLPAGRDRVGVVDTDHGKADILLERTRGPPPVWRISAGSVAELAALYEALGGGLLAEHLPGWFFEIELLELALWQWLGLATLVTLAALGAWLAVYAMVWIVRASGGRRSLEEHGYLRAALGPLRLGLAVGLFALGVPLLVLAVPPSAFLSALARTLAIAAFAWLLARLVSAASGRLEARLRDEGKFAAIALVPMGRRAVIFALAAITLLAALQNLGVNVTGIIAGLGIGGLAIALAAQKTVENLFGGLTLVADQPVRVGDFCRFGERLGTVEEIGLRSTRVRTLDRTLVSVPNSEFSSLQLENYAARDHMRFIHMIGVRYETTPDQMRTVLESLRKLLQSNPRVHPDPARVRFVRFGAFSQDIEIFAYITTSDYNEFLELAEDLLLRIAETVLENGLEFAFPSQTVYVGRDATTALPPPEVSE